MITHYINNGTVRLVSNEADVLFRQSKLKFRFVNRFKACLMTGKDDTLTSIPSNSKTINLIVTSSPIIIDNETGWLDI